MACNIQSFTDQFKFISNNDIICPIVHFYENEEGKNPVVLYNYKNVEGSFTLKNEDVDFGTEVTNVRSRYTTMNACMSGRSIPDEDTFRLYYF